MAAALSLNASAALLAASVPPEMLREATVQSLTWAVLGFCREYGWDQAEAATLAASVAGRLAAAAAGPGPGQLDRLVGEVLSHLSEVAEVYAATPLPDWMPRLGEAGHG